MVVSHKVLLSAAVAISSLAGLTTTAGAATVGASSVIEAVNPSLSKYMGSAPTPGTSATARANVFNILGNADGSFYSLGKLGYVILSFGTPTIPFAGATVVIEIGTGGDTATNREQAEVYVGNDIAGLRGLALGDSSNSLSVGHIASNITTTFNIAGGPWSYMLIKDTSLSGNTTYGIDIDSVRVTPASTSPVSSAAVPLPAGVWGGLALMATMGAGKLHKRSKR